MNQATCDAQLAEFARQAYADGRNFPLKDVRSIILNEDTPETDPIGGFGYLMHCGWAARKLAATGPQEHWDFSSFLYFASIASALVPRFRFFDIRPYQMPLPGLVCERADLVNLHFPDNTAESISCLHVMEHVGLGRYGDAVDSTGDVKAARELVRVLRPGGRLIMVLPLNQQHGVVWNAHRHYAHHDVIGMFSGLHLLEFTLIKGGHIVWNTDASQVVSSHANTDETGCFWFQKP